MTGYHGKFLHINMTTKTAKSETYPEDWQKKYIGGRGFAARYLWEHLTPGAKPFSPENILIFAVGPLSGLSLPSSSKLIVAAKSPLTGGYGDGNIGTRASPNLKRSGWDAIIVTGRAENPTYVEIDNEEISFHDASHLWGKGTYETEEILKETYGIRPGILSIGQAGENLVKYATVRSQEGRSGGRPGMGAVMGSKHLKAIVVKGTMKEPVVDMEGYKKLGKEGYQIIKKKPNYEHWMNQATTMVLEWCHETSTLPTRNFQEGQFELQMEVNGDKLQEIKTGRAGCPRCNMTCGLIIKDNEGRDSELDYENVGMLGPNLGIGDMPTVGVLNYDADDYGLDTISLGSVLGMAAEAAQNGVLGEEFAWGDAEKARELIQRLALREEGDDLAYLLGEGTRNMANEWKEQNPDAVHWAIHVKGLECSAYNAFSIPGMALSFGTSPIGAHHKDAWVISYEISETDRDSYETLKADKVIELQRIRGGLFENVGNCRFPWIEVGYDENNYSSFMKQVTGKDYWSMDEIYRVSDRVYNLMRAFWVREFTVDGLEWTRQYDYPPSRWFDQKLKGDGPYNGVHLDRDKYGELLDYYYSKRGWDDRGIPTKETLEKFDLKDVIDDLTPIVDLN